MSAARLLYSLVLVNTWTPVGQRIETSDFAEEKLLGCTTVEKLRELQKSANYPLVSPGLEF